MPGLAQHSCPDLCASATLCMRPPGAEEGQPELADLDLIPIAEVCFLDPFPVHIGAVQTAYVTHGEPRRVPVELRVAPGHRHVVQEYVASWMAPDRGQVAVEQKPAARVRATFDQEQSGTCRKGFGRGRRLGQGVFNVGLGQVGAGQGDRRCALPRPLAPAAQQRGTAVRTKTCAFGTGSPTAGAVDARHRLVQPLLRRPRAWGGNHIRRRGSWCQLGYRRPRYLRHWRLVHAPRALASAGEAPPPATSPPHRPPPTSIPAWAGGTRCAGGKVRLSHGSADTSRPLEQLRCPLALLSARLLCLGARLLCYASPVIEQSL